MRSLVPEANWSSGVSGAEATVVFVLVKITDIEVTSFRIPTREEHSLAIQASPPAIS